MNTRLAALAAALVALAAIVAAALLGSGGSATGDGAVPGRSAARPAPPSPTGAAAELVGAAEGTRGVADVRAEPGARAATEPSAPPREDGAAAGPAGIAIRGTILLGDSGDPAPALELVLVQGEIFAFPTSDAGGRFASAPLFTPGVVEVRHRRSDPGGPHPVQLRPAPGTLEIAGAPGDSVDVELRFHPPAGVLLVEAVRLDGAPVAGADVELEVARGGDAVRSILGAATDADGVARIGLHAIGDEVAVGAIARLERDGRVELTSELRRLDTPIVAAGLQEPVRLVLDAPGAIDVSVTARDGSPAPAWFVLVDDLDPDLGWWTGPVPRTDRAGEASAEGLPPGRYGLRLPGAPGIGTREVDVDAGARAEARFVLAVDRIELAVSGRMVDADGSPLPERSLDVRVLPGGARHVVDGDRAGRFELFTPPGESVVIDAGGGLFSDVYEPARLEVPFGATEVVLRRVRDIELRHVSFEVVRAGTNERVPDVLVMTYRAPYRGDFAFHRAEDGLASPRLAIDDTTRLVVEAPGHRRAEVTLDALLETVGPDGVGRVEVRPGFEREVIVVAAEGGSPVAGARLRTRAREIARTGADGRARVDLDLWPGEGLEVTAEGFRARIWRPEEGAADLEPALVELRRDG